MNTTLELPRTLHPDKSIAQAAGSAPLKPYAFPPKDPRPVLDQLTQDPQRSVLLSKRRSKVPADFRRVFATLIKPADRKIIDDLQRRIEEIIAVIRANDNATIRRAYDAERASFQGDSDAVRKLAKVKPLEERLNQGREVRRQCEGAIDKITAEETRPLCLRILRDALAVARTEFERIAKAERDLWAEVGVAYETSELWLSLRDGFEAIQQQIESNLSGLSGEVTPLGVLRSHGIAL